jgi:hypothetical protein
MHFPTLNVNGYNFKSNFMFINNDGMQFYIVYNNLDNDNVCTKFTHLHCICISCYTITLEPIIKHLVTKDMNKFCLLMDE